MARQTELSDQYLEMNIGLAAAMVVLLDSKDEYTAQHSAAVAMYCRDMATALELPEEEAEALHFAGLLHDLGKVGVPDAVLRKTTALDDEEWEFIRQHPEKGAEVLSHLAAYQEVADIVRYHHERLDGSGYPSGIHGDAHPRAQQDPGGRRQLPRDDLGPAVPRRAQLVRGAQGAAPDGRARRWTHATWRSSRKVLRDKDLAYRDGSSTDFMGEYERGRINLRLRGHALADVSGLAERAGRPSGRLTRLRAASAGRHRLQHVQPHERQRRRSAPPRRGSRCELQREPGRAEGVDRHEPGQARDARSAAAMRSAAPRDERRSRAPPATKPQGSRRWARTATPRPTCRPRRPARPGRATR